MPNCGIEKLYVAKQLADAAGGMTFEAPQYYKNVQELDIKPKINTDKAYAENRLIDQETMFDSAEIGINRYAMSSAERAYLFGQTIASNGGIIASLGDEPPFIAILYKAPIKTADGTRAYRYGVIYKTQFTLPDDQMKGLEGKPDLGQIPKITGTSQPTNWSFKDVNGVEKHPWEYHVDTTDPNCPENIEETWFTSVTVPGADTTAPTLIVTPADAATNVATDSNIVWTFSKAINAAILNSANFFLMKATDGILVPGKLTIDSAYKVVTLDPTDALSASTAYIAVCTTNITDLAGNHLETTSITNFTTA